MELDVVFADFFYFSEYFVVFVFWKVDERKS